MLRRHLIFAVLAGLLVACAGELTTQGEPLRFTPRTPPMAFTGEQFSHNIQVVGGLSPYTYTLREGTLPPGLQLQGGFIRGVPTDVGRHTFTLAVSDANLSVREQQFTIEVREPPPASLRFNVPNTEMRTPFILRVNVEDARELVAFRTELRWDTARFRLNERSLRALQGNLALLSQYESGVLSIDVAVLGGSLSGQQPVFELELVPLEPSTIQVEGRSEFISLDGRHAFSRALEGTPPPRPTPTAPDAPEPPADTDPVGDTGDDAGGESQGETSGEETEGTP